MDLKPSLRNEFLVGEVASRLKVSPQTIKRWIKKGKIPAKKNLYGWYYIKAADIESFVGKHNRMVREISTWT